MTVTLADGSRQGAFVPHVLGFPSHPMGRADVEAKALDLMAGPLGADRAEAVVTAVRNLDAAPDARVLINLIAR